MGAIVQEQAVEEVSKEMELQKLGDNVDKDASLYALKNNFDADTYAKAEDLVTTAESVQLVEMLVKATMPTKLPIDGGEHPQGLTWADVEAEMFKA